MREMVEDYSRQLEVRDQHIRRLEAACDGEVAMLAQKEVEVLKQENRMLRDKVAHMSDEIAHLGAGAASDANYRALQDEVDRLSQLLMEKDRQLDREMADQKHEWAEIYNAQKAQNDQIQREVSLLNQENEKLLRKLELQEKKGGGGSSSHIQAELAEASKRLKKRELECQALWDTLKDLKTSDRKVFDVNQMKAVLAKRSLDTKAQRKLALDQ